MGKHVKFVVQSSQQGLGHAVLLAASEIGNDPFLLLLGDHVYRSRDHRSSCSRQLVEAFVRHGTSVVGLQYVNTHQLASVGVATGSWLDDQGPTMGPPNEQRMLYVSEVQEKPSPAYAHKHMLQHTCSDSHSSSSAGSYLGFFGQYVLSAHIFRILQEMKEKEVSSVDVHAQIDAVTAG